MINFEDIIQVRFLKKNDCIKKYKKNTIESNIKFNDLLILISEIEQKTGGLGSSVHKEAFTGVDYLGNNIKFNSYIVVMKKSILKFNFNESWVPFSSKILSEKRENNINKILNKNS